MLSNTKMNKEKQEEIIAKLALSEYERKAKLKKIINETSLHCYFCKVHGICSILIMSACLYGFLSNQDKLQQLFAFMVVILIFQANAIRMNKQKFNALIKLLEIEKNENEVASPNSDTAAAESE